MPQQAPNQTAETVEDASSLWVIVRCNQNLIGFDADCVGNMIALPKVTRVPGTDDFMSGTITVRGSIIPLIDLRVYTGQKSADEEVDEFDKLMDQRLLDHQNWIQELKASVEEERTFKLTSDPHQCAFGKWYDSYQTNDRFVAAVLAKFDQPHKTIHGIATTVEELVAKEQLDQAHQLIDQTAAGELQLMVGLFDEVKKAAREASRRRIAMVLELEERTLALDIDEVVAVESISKFQPAPPQQTDRLGIEKIGRRDKDDELVLLMEDVAF